MIGLLIATHLALSSYSRSYSTPSYRSSYSAPRTTYSAPKSYSSPSRSSSSTKSTSSTSRSSNTSKSTYKSPSTSYTGKSYFGGKTYNYSTPYYNNSGLWIFFWVWVATSNGHGYYKCYDDDHKETSCNRSETKDVTHNGSVFHVSQPYKNTKDQSVTYWQQYIDNKQKKFYECFDTKFGRITCDRKS